MSREIIFPNLMEPNQLLIMHERNICLLFGSRRKEEMERTTLGRHFSRRLLLVLSCTRLAVNHGQWWRTNRPCKTPSSAYVWRKMLTLWRVALTACFPTFLWYQSGLNAIFISTPTETDKKNLWWLQQAMSKAATSVLLYVFFFFVHAGGFWDTELKVIQQKWKCVSRGFRIAVIREFFSKVR